VVSPELTAMRDLLTATGRLDPDVAPADQRAVWDMLALLYPLPDDVTVTAPDAAGVRGEWIDTPGADPGRVLLYLHGGGYVIGSPTTHRLLAGRLSAALGARVLLLDYRLAPEHRFPAALDDTVAAYRWILGLGHEPGQLCVAGDSAGGGLAVAATVALRDQGVALPAAVACWSPWVDLSCTMPSIVARDERDVVLSKRWLTAMAAHYLHGVDATTALASPLYADLTGLPPLLVVVGTEEILYDEAAALATQAVAAGVDTEFEVFDGCFHLWMQLAALAPEAEAGIRRVAAFLRSRLT